MKIGQLKDNKVNLVLGAFSRNQFLLCKSPLKSVSQPFEQQIQFGNKFPIYRHKYLFVVLRCQQFISTILLISKQVAVRIISFFVDKMQMQMTAVNFTKLFYHAKSRCSISPTIKTKISSLNLLTFRQTLFAIHPIWAPIKLLIQFALKSLKLTLGVTLSRQNANNQTLVPEPQITVDT